MSALHANRNVDQAERRRRDAGNAAGLSDGDGANALEGFAHFAGEAADDAVVDPVGNGDGFSGFEFVDGLALLIEVAGELDLGLDGAGGTSRFRILGQALSKIGKHGIVGENIGQRMQDGLNADFGSLE